MSPVAKLQFGDVRIGDKVAGGTATSILLASSYNWGFFSASNSSFLSLLTVEDILVGATIAIIPAIGGLVVGMLLGTLENTTAPVILQGAIGVFDRSVDLIKWRRPRVGIVLLVVGIPASLATAFWIQTYSTFAPDMEPLGYLFSGFLVFYGTLALGAPRLTLRTIVLVWLLFAPFVLGRAEFYKILTDSRAKESSITLTDGSSVSGKIARTSASYVFIIDNGRLVAWPLSRVASLSTPM